MCYEFSYKNYIIYDLCKFKLYTLNRKQNNRI